MDSARLGAAKCCSGWSRERFASTGSRGRGPGPGPARPGATSRPPARGAPGACRERPPCRAARAVGPAGTAACLVCCLWAEGVVPGHPRNGATGAAVPYVTCWAGDAACQGCCFGATFSLIAVHPLLVLLRSEIPPFKSPMLELGIPVVCRENTWGSRSYYKSLLPWRNINGKNPGKYLKPLFGVQRAQKLNCYRVTNTSGKSIEGLNRSTDFMTPWIPIL